MGMDSSRLKSLYKWNEVVSQATDPIRGSESMLDRRKEDR